MLELTYIYIFILNTEHLFEVPNTYQLTEGRNCFVIYTCTCTWFRQWREITCYCYQIGRRIQGLAIVVLVGHQVIVDLSNVVSLQA